MTCSNLMYLCVRVRSGFFLMRTSLKSDLLFFLFKQNSMLAAIQNKNISMSGLDKQCDLHPCAALIAFIFVWRVRHTLGIGCCERKIQKHDRAQAPTVKWASITGVGSIRLEYFPIESRPQKHSKYHPVRIIYFGEILLQTLGLLAQYKYHPFLTIGINNNQCL